MPATRRILITHLLLYEWNSCSSFLRHRNNWELCCPAKCAAVWPEIGIGVEIPCRNQTKIQWFHSTAQWNRAKMFWFDFRKSALSFANSQLVFCVLVFVFLDATLCFAINGTFLSLTAERQRGWSSTPYWPKFKLCHFAHVFICFAYSNCLFAVEYFQRKISTIWSKWTNPFPHVFETLSTAFVSSGIVDQFQWLFLMISFFSSLGKLLRDKFSSVLPVAYVSNVHWQKKRREFNYAMNCPKTNIFVAIQSLWIAVCCLFSKWISLVSSSWCINGWAPRCARFVCIHRANSLKCQFHYIVIMDKLVFGFNQLATLNARLKIQN